MKMIKTIKTCCLSLLLMLCLLPLQAIRAEEKPTVTVSTSFIEDIVQKITDDSVNIELIIPRGSDPHLYSPLASDLDNILNADLILYQGLHLEAQMAEVLADYGYAVTQNFNPDDLISVNDGSEVDPHYWFDLNLYKQSVEEITNLLIETYPNQSELYQNNSNQYLAELDELQLWVEDKLEELPVENRILVTPHDAYAYFARNYAFQVYAPQGISTESEVSNEQIIQTVDFVVNHQVPAIFLDTTSNPQAMTKLQEGIAQKGHEVKIVGGEGQELYSDSLAPSGQENDTFIKMYQHNVNLIVENLTK
ncbi:metal ABC transporter solute-binding protein, Zn/Mn family [Fundicoccus culcitae]|uniref:Zinc ABC transporter substrate-binding protein n=1 Tax=Fundicoccus culcitae TaxID=2969821 RepID=A0ABY5P7L4_9LACT|nr:zinc ABC transporter substrate-binding protein [Fundicoccus culcitae]UUX34490.1 zinc ABC transporter substrate-binding protein [Fundicoccus culcitae]